MHARPAAGGGTRTLVAGAPSRWATHTTREQEARRACKAEYTAAERNRSGVVAGDPVRPPTDSPRGVQGPAGLEAATRHGPKHPHPATFRAEHSALTGRPGPPHALRLACGTGAADPPPALREDQPARAPSPGGRVPAAGQGGARRACALVLRAARASPGARSTT